LLALCTDGITESADELGEEFGQERLVECLRRHDSLGAQELGAAVIKDVLAFSGGRQFDDLTLIVALREG
jgi:serine phosphatase RsbU (regulator of sigma subunit)